MKVGGTLGLLCLLTAVKAQVPFIGICPELRTMGNFSLERYMGKWYEAERYFSLMEFGGKCVETNYTESNDNININIISKQLSSLTGSRSTMSGEVRKMGDGKDAKMNMKFPYLPDAPYWILDTDYDSYSVVWSCTNFGIFSARSAWILTRERHPPLEVMEKSYSVVDKNLISRAFFIRTDQNNCPED